VWLKLSYLQRTSIQGSLGPADVAQSDQGGDASHPPTCSSFLMQDKAM